MKRKCTALLLALVMTLSLMTVSAGAAGSPFSDVTEADWFYKEAVYVKEQGLMLGSNGKFNPNAATSRAMIWMILARLDGTDTTPTDNEWFGVGKAWSIANGVSDGTNPNGSITRQQLAVMLYRYAMGKGCVKTGDYADLSAYADADSVSDYAREAMSWAVAVGLLNGTADGRLNPLGTATRAHVAVMLYRFRRLIDGTAAETYTVTFLYNYGKKGTYTTQAVAADDLAQRPKDPTRSGYDFAGWYDRATGGKRFTFGTAVTGDLTLYAHWTDDSDDDDSSTSVHSHSYRYTCNNNGTHTAKCTCGSSYTENCALVKDETTGLSTCSACGYAVYEISDWATFVAAMAAGGNIKLTTDLTADEAGPAVVEKMKTVHLDMNGHTITLADGSDDSFDPFFKVRTGASLTIDGNGTVDLGANPGFSFMCPYGDVTINSGTYKIDTGLSSYGSFFIGINGGKGKLIINGGYFDGGYYKEGDCFNNCRNLLNASWGQYIRVYGGTFVAQNPAWGDEGMAYLCTECEHTTDYCQGIFLDGQHREDITMPAHYTITEGTTKDGRPTYTVNYNKTTVHTYNVYTNNGDGTHTAKCACGAVGGTATHTLTNGLCVCDYAEVSTVEQMSAAVTAGKTNIKVIGEVYDEITAAKTVDFKNATFTAATANNEGISFTSANGQKYTISNAKFTGETQAIFFGSYNKNNPGNYDTELKNVTLENIKTFGSYANKGKNVSCAAWVYGTAALNDCTMKGTTSGNTDTNICCDVGFVNKSNATVSGGSFDSMYIYEQAHVTIENAKVGKIVTGAITTNNLGCLTIKSGTTVDTIEINCSDSFTPALVIEDGATVTSITYQGTTYTQAAWLAVQSSGSN